MKFSRKGEEPQCLTDHLAQANENWIPSYENFRSKKELLPILLAEQGFVCAYCGRKVSGQADSHIEHYCCQTHFADRELDYSNMFASCGPPKQRRLPSTCGDAKGNTPPPAPCILPSDPGCEARFSYGESGEAIPLDDGAKNMVPWLKLNDSSLVQERAALIAEVAKMIISGEITLSDKADEILLWRSPNAEGQLRSFGHVAARYLEEAL